MSRAAWQSIRDRKLADCAARIPKEWLISSENLPGPDVADVTNIPRTCGILTPKELHITEAYDTRSLAVEIRNRKLSAVEVTTAFCKRAAISHQLTNCLTEPLFAPALSRASELDAHLARTGQPLGLLHGLPISVKDSFHITGTDSSIGIAALAFNPAKKNAALVDLLLRAGAVIHCKTNVPQTLMALDSVNNLFGRTLNPLNRRDWTAGGSSGGEGVLVAMRGSVMGVGTDVGGSIRVPAMCNGMYGFKPSAGRVPYAGQENGTLDGAGRVGLQSCAGPITRTLEDVGVFMEAVESGKAWKADPAVLPGRWWSDGVEEGRSVRRIGVLWRDGVVEPLPPVQKILEEVAQKLRRKAIDVIDIKADRWKDCQSLANKFFGLDGHHRWFDLLSRTQESLIPWLQTRLKRSPPKTLDQLREFHAKRTELETAFLHVWNDTHGDPIDAIICPVAPHPVPPIDRWNGVSYTSSFVLLDYPAATLPVRALTKEDLKGEMSGEVLSPWDRVNRGLWEGGGIERSVYLGSPMGVQVVAPRLQERRLWDAMRVVEDAVHGREGRARL